MKKSVTYLLIFCAILFSYARGGAENQGKDQSAIILTGGNIWDGKAEKLLGTMEILVKDGKIVEMGKSVSRPKGAKIIDLSGHTVTPGFMDCHVHMTCDPDNFVPSMLTKSATSQVLFSLRGLRDVLMNGFTTVRDIAAFDLGYETVDLKRAIEAGEIVGPRMFVAPHLISCTAGHGDPAGLLSPEFGSSLKAKAVGDSPDELRKIVREEVRGGADWIKCCSTGGFSSPSDDPSQITFTQEEMNAIVQAAHDFGIPVAVHAYGAEGIRRAVLAGVDSVEHGSLASPETLKLIERKGIYVVPTQYGFEPMLDNANNPKARYWASHTPQEYFKTVKYADALRKGQKDLANSNVKIVYGTDTGTFPFKDNWKEFPAMVKNGITPLRALKAATSMAAEMLKRPDLGVLEVGKTADIVAMPGNPFEDIEVTGKVDFVMKDGVIYKLNGRSVPQS